MRLVKNIGIIAVDLAENIETIRQITPISFPGIVIISSKKQALKETNISKKSQII